MNLKRKTSAASRSNRTGSLGGDVSREIRLVDADKLVDLRRKGESIGLSGRWGSEWLATNLQRDTRFPIRVILVNHRSFDLPPYYAPLEGSCFRCLVLTTGENGAPTQFSIDLDSVDFEQLEVMSSDDVMSLTHHLLDWTQIQTVDPSSG